MDISLVTMIEKYNNCVDSLDLSKTCDTCRYHKCEFDDITCNNCYNEFLGLPVNPTKWVDRNCPKL